MSADPQPGPAHMPTIAGDRQTEALRVIKAAYEKRTLVLVVGAGVTINSLRARIPAPPPQVIDRLTWPGLLQHGLGYVEEVRNNLSPMSPFEKDSFDGASRALQGKARGSLTTKDLIRIAGLVKDGLLAQNQLADWLQLSLGRLYDEYVEGETIGILQSMEVLYKGGTRIMTTNYDDIVERYCKARSILPQDKIDMNKFLRGASDAGVLHVHGHWEDAQNAVLDIVDYHTTTSDKSLQALLRQLLDSSAVLLFVGTGGGLDDPNFGGLLAWAKAQFNNQVNRHYVLLRTGDCLEDQSVLSPVFYGSDFGDLGPFLQSIAGCQLAQEGP